jgi:WhiB family redox-sensing transcriptional regulator
VIHIRHEKWRQDAACQRSDPELFFPTKDTSSDEIDDVKTICAECPVWDKCLDSALRLDERDGIWGGLTPHERRQLLVDVRG